MMDQQLIIEQAVRRLLEAAPAGSEVILFGSHARGDAGQGSDLDFLVVEPNVEDRRHEAVRLRKVLGGMTVGVDILVTSRDVFEDWKETPNNVLHHAWKEGRVYREVG
jgi:predicted nucleotidyltransferase